MRNPRNAQTFDPLFQTKLIDLARGKKDEKKAEKTDPVGAEGEKTNEKKEAVVSG